MFSFLNLFEGLSGVWELGLTLGLYRYTKGKPHKENE